MKIISISVDLSKIDKSKIVVGKNGVAKYYNMIVTLNDTPDQYGNDASVSNSQTKEERTAKAKKTFIGSGKVIFSKDAQPARQSQPASSSNESDDLPF